MSQRAANLDGHPFSSGAAAEQVGQPGADHDQGDEPEGDVLGVAVTGFKEQGHAFAAGAAHLLVAPDDAHAHQAQEGEQRINVRHAEGGHRQQHPTKEGVDGADGQPQGEGDEGEQEGIAVSSDSFVHDDCFLLKMQKKPTSFCNRNTEGISFKERFQRVLWEYLIPTSL